MAQALLQPQTTTSDLSNFAPGNGARQAIAIASDFATARCNCRPQLGACNFCPEIRVFAGLGARFLQPFPKSLETVKYYSNTKVAVNSP